jgi:hypothetical protein
MILSNHIGSTSRVQFLFKNDFLSKSAAGGMYKLLFEACVKALKKDYLKHNSQTAK